MLHLRWLSIFVIPFALLSLQACAPKAQPDCGYVQNVYGERVSWKGKTPIALYLHQSFPAEYIPTLQSAINKWETADGKPLFQIIASNMTSPASAAQDGVSMVYFMNTWEPDRPTEQARTSVYWIGNEIREADIRINSAIFRFYTLAPVTGSDVDLESLLIHELGHVLGLKHNDSSASVMATYLKPATKRTDIAAADAAALKCEY